MSDERLGLPSASTMARTENCPGWLNLKAQVEREHGPLKDTGDALATEGTDIHKAYETGDDSELEADPKEIARRLEDLTNRAVSEWAAQFPEGAHIEQLREQRLFLRDAALKPIASAQVDRAYICGHDALIIDAKTGFLEPTPSEGNWQIRTQVACLVSEYGDVTKVRAGFAWSRLSQKLDVSDYDADILVVITGAIMVTAWKATQPDATRHAGSWCFYCPVKAHCREAAMYGAMVAYEYQGMNEVDIINKVGTLTPSGLALVWKKRKVVEKIVDAVNERLKALPDAELEALGIKRVEGKRRVTVTDNALVAKMLLAAGLLDEPDTRRLFKPEMAKIIDFVAAAKGLSKVKAKEAVEETITPALSITRDSGFLKEK